MSNVTIEQSVIQAADYSPNYSGNFIASLRSAAKECRALGLRSVWVFPEEARNRVWLAELARDTNGPVYILPRIARGHLRYAWQLAQIARRENAAILHTHFSRFDIAAWLAQRICALSGQHLELIWHMHSAFSFHPTRLRLWRDALKLRVLGRTCHLVPVCEELREHAMGKGCPEQRLLVIPNGIDTAHVLERKRTREEVRKELEVPDDTLLLLGLGWEPVRKGVDVMLEALDAVCRSGRKAILVLVGTDDRLERFVQAWPLRTLLPNVRVIRSVEHVGDLYGAADIFISASRAEGFNYSVAEAMVNGLPVISTRIPSLAWAFDAPGISFFSSENSRDLAGLIGRVAARSEEQGRHEAELSKRFVCDGYSVEKWAQSVTGLYAQVLSGHPKASFA